MAKPETKKRRQRGNWIEALNVIESEKVAEDGLIEVHVGVDNYRGSTQVFIVKIARHSGFVVNKIRLPPSTAEKLAQKLAEFAKKARVYEPRVLVQKLKELGVKIEESA